LGTIESITGSYATTGSNTFYGTQVFTGSVYIANDLIVQGSSSIQYISASSVSIGTNIINLNTATPSIRYAGLSIIDSGSSGVSASLLWDSQTDDFIFTHRSSGSQTLDSSMFIYGPLNTGSLDNIVGVLSNRLTKGQNNGTGHDHHITSSQISDDGTTVSIPGALTVTGNITGPIRATNGVVSGSSQVVSIANSQLANSTISGKALGTNLDTLTIGTGLSGTSYNGSSAVTIANSGVTSIVAGTNISISGGTGAVTITNGVTNNNQLTNGAGYITGGGTVDYSIFVNSRDTRNTNDQPQDFAALAKFDFKANSTNGLSDGSSYNGVMTYRPYGSSTDFSGGPAHQIGFTHNGNLWYRSGTTNAWGSWTKILNSSNYGGYATFTTAITSTGDITAYYSDGRLKENLKVISNPIEKITKLTGYTYNTNDLGKTLLNTEDDNDNKVGLIAQDLQKILPEAVKLAPFDRDEKGNSKSGENYLTIQYEKVVPLLVEAIKEQQIKIDNLTIEVENLKKPKGL
jgi:hypothetical protein